VSSEPHSRNTAGRFPPPWVDIERKANRFLLFRHYNKMMVTWDEDKRIKNLRKHRIDLADCASIFDYPMLTEEDASEDYGEARFKSLGFCNARVVVLIWTEREESAHLISCRYANKREIQDYDEAL
jgi:uncharacterized protein